MNNGPFLLDTMVLSEGFKSRPDSNAFEWLKASSYRENTFLSVISIGEVARGIRRLEFVEKRTSERYIRWLETTLLAYGDRVLPVTVDIARFWGHISFDLKNTNPDLLIAATALEHDLIVVTRNVRHFGATGVKIFNPYE